MYPKLISVHIHCLRKTHVNSTNVYNYKKLASKVSVETWACEDI